MSDCDCWKKLCALRVGLVDLSYYIVLHLYYLVFDFKAKCLFHYRSVSIVNFNLDSQNHTLEIDRYHTKSENEKNEYVILIKDI